MNKHEQYHQYLLAAREEALSTIAKLKTGEVDLEKARKAIELLRSLEPLLNEESKQNPIATEEKFDSSLQTDVSLPKRKGVNFFPDVPTEQRYVPDREVVAIMGLIEKQHGKFIFDSQTEIAKKLLLNPNSDDKEELKKAFQQVYQAKRRLEESLRNLATMQGKDPSGTLLRRLEFQSKNPAWSPLFRYLTNQYGQYSIKRFSEEVLWRFMTTIQPETEYIACGLFIQENPDDRSALVKGLVKIAGGVKPFVKQIKKAGITKISGIDPYDESVGDKAKIAFLNLKLDEYLSGKSRDSESQMIDVLGEILQRKFQYKRYSMLYVTGSIADITQKPVRSDEHRSIILQDVIGTEKFDSQRVKIDPQFKACKLIHCLAQTAAGKRKELANIFYPEKKLVYREAFDWSTEKTDSI
jgi:hypothetical protein